MSDFKTDEFIQKNPLQYLPFLEDGDVKIAESAAIAEYGEWGLLVDFIMAWPGLFVFLIVCGGGTA